MIPVPSGARVWLATGVTYMRRGMNTLALQVQQGAGPRAACGTAKSMWSEAAPVSRTTVISPQLPSAVIGTRAGQNPHCNDLLWCVKRPGGPRSRAQEGTGTRDREIARPGEEAGSVAMEPAAIVTDRLLPFALLLGHRVW